MILLLGVAGDADGADHLAGFVANELAPALGENLAARGAETSQRGELAAEFGVEAPPSVKNIADIAKRDLKRINNPNDVMAMPYSLIATRRWPQFNIFTGST